MDSGNSGSLQSSSGGDDREEYDSISRPEPVQSYLNHSLGTFNPLSNQHTSPLGNSQPTYNLDHSSNYLQVLSQSQQNSSNPHSLLNLDEVHSRGIRSDPNCTDLGNLQGSSSSILASQGLSQISSMKVRSVHDNGARSLSPTDKTNVVKNSKKRTRASRRAPTTVLTTDTSNFRQMVQEFTGIPAPPFSGSSYSRRLDLFGSGSALRSGHFEPLGPLYSLHPSAQKVQLQQTPFVSSASSHSILNNTVIADATSIATATNNNSVTTSVGVAAINTFNSTSSNYQLPSDLGLPKPPQNVSNMQQPNQIFSFQSLLQPPPHAFNHSLNAPSFGPKSQVSLTIPSLEELGMSQSHGHVSANFCGLPKYG
ncbi:VQ domain-containing protein [Cephalotus follicularis]|uniref:VQ domain-containing protein n=1 Tax=Cephalotus follicularis TaxID=3775 RepID=A0A1Q3AUB2_CEPFO|nr:VQ domain-containing protein [Cephalotus follicularis]